jgi:HK97 family phage major capsid protein
MALDGKYATGSSVNNTNHATFIPKLWSDEIIAEYEKSLVMKPLVKSMKMTGKKGDTINIPMPVRGEAAAKVKETQVTLVADSSGNKQVTIDQHWEYSRLIEDITSVQALGSMRKFYTQDAGYALATKVDTDLIAAAIAGWTTVGHMTDTGLVVPAVAGSAGDFSDQGFRDGIQILDDANVPMDKRKLVIPPSARNHIMGIDRYVSSDFVNGRGVVNGKIGELYGVDVYVSTNLPDNGSDEKPCLLFHTDALVIAEQMSVRTQTQYKQEYLADLMTADTLYGFDDYRPECGVVMYVAN